MKRRRERTLADLILELVAETPRTGFEICQALEEDEALTLRGREGSIYAALVQLTREGYLAASVEPSESGRRRRYRIPVLVDIAEDGR